MNRNHAMLTAALAIASFALLGSPIARAQRAPVRSMSAAPAPVPVSGRRVTSSGVRVNSNRSGVRRSTATSASTQHAADAFGIGGGFPLSLQDLLNITPNSGFNWQFVNAINQDLPIKAFIDPVTQIEVAQAEHLLGSTRGAFSGAYILGGGGYYVPPESEEGAQGAEQTQYPETQPEQGSQPPPQIIVLQQAPVQQPSQPSGAEAAPPEEELPAQGEFTLVLRNGKQLETVAFTRANDKIVYITPNGGRLTIAAADLDADATVRINQERGTPLELPL
jgi:hypothetical protein